jgi:hypothetical protein
MYHDGGEKKNPGDGAITPGASVAEPLREEKEGGRLPVLAYQQVPTASG